MDRKRLFNASSNVEYVASGYVLFLREQVLMAQPFDASKLETTGKAAPIAGQISYDELNLVGRFSASQNGVLACRFTCPEPCWIPTSPFPDSDTL